MHALSMHALRASLPIDGRLATGDVADRQGRLDGGRCGGRIEVMCLPNIPSTIVEWMDYRQGCNHVALNLEKPSVTEILNQPTIPPHQCEMGFAHW